MESLALVVGIIFLTALIAGPSALGISYLPTGKYFSPIAKKIVVSIISVVASMVGALLVVSTISIGGRLLGVASLSCATVAVYRVFQLPKPNQEDPTPIG